MLSRSLLEFKDKLCELFQRFRYKDTPTNEDILEYVDAHIQELFDVANEQKPVKTAMEAWKEMRLEVYAQASGNRHEPNYSDDSSKIFSLNDIDEIFEKVYDSVIEQKPVEWSKEDEEHLNRIVKELSSQQTRSINAPYVDVINSDITWIKSLRPQKQWKPTLQQINALSIVVKHGQTDDTDALKELLEQLKAL